MGLWILTDRKQDRSVLYDSVTETAFGPGFVGDDCEDQADSFLTWLKVDARALGDALLREAYVAWHNTHMGEDGLLDEPLADCGNEAFELSLAVLRNGVRSSASRVLK